MYNDEGSVKDINRNGHTDLYFWDDNQRLMAVMNPTGLHNYFYDHTGQRVLKGTMRSVSGAMNGSDSYRDLILDAYVVYVNPFYTVTHYNDHTEATKHYYMNAQRVATSVISYMSSSYDGPVTYEPFEVGSPGTVNVIATIIDKLFDWEIMAYPSGEISFQHLLEPVDIELLYPSAYYAYDIEPCESDPHCKCEQSQHYSKLLYDIDCYQINITYWYHPDYLGSIEWVTNADGRPMEYFWYSPWGETLQADNSWRGRFSSPFKFTGHIEDEETGLTYAGARYYPARESQWLSVDPLAEYFPSWTPYHYVHNNPVNLVDPDGRNAVDEVKGKHEPCPFTPVEDNTQKNNSNWFNQMGRWISKQITGKGKLSNPAPQFEFVDENERSVSLSERNGAPTNANYEFPRMGRNEVARVNYDMFNVPDAIVVTYNDQEILNSNGPVSGTGSSNALIPATRRRLGVFVTPQPQRGTNESSWYNVDLTFTTGPTVFRKSTRMAFFGLIPISKIDRITGDMAERLISEGRAQRGTNFQQKWNRRNPLRLKKL